MARPKTIKLNDGEVILKNLPKEVSDKIVEFLGKGIVTNEQNTPEGFSMDVALFEKEPSNDSFDHNLPLEDFAFSVKKNNSGNWEVITVNYNSESRQAIVVNVKDYGKEKSIAVGDFKVLVARKLLKEE